MKEIVAKEIFGTSYMTRAEELPIEQRMYWERISGVNPSVTDYRGATEEERDEWRKELDMLDPLNN